MAGIVIDATASARDGEPCARVVALTALSPMWASAVASLQEQIAMLSAPDCLAMTLSLEPREGEMQIVAMTPDGRRTERTVHGPDGLVAVAMGLLMAVPAEPPATSFPPPAPTATPPSPAAISIPPAPLSVAPPAASSSDRTPTLPSPPMVPPETTPKTIALWAGVCAGVRITAPTALNVLDIEARADILFGPWLMPITLRSAIVSCLGQQGVDCDVYNDVSIGAGVGRRFHLGGPDVDVAFEPSLVVMHMEYDGASDAEGETVAGTEVALRLDVSARLAVPVAPQWVLTVTVDGGIAPSLLARPTRLDAPSGAAAGAPPLPLFPGWSGGVRVGVSGALL